jgi:hypothetical protein
MMGQEADLGGNRPQRGAPGPRLTGPWRWG